MLEIGDWGNLGNKANRIERVGGMEVWAKGFLAVFRIAWCCILFIRNAKREREIGQLDIVGSSHARRTHGISDRCLQCPLHPPSFLGCFCPTLDSIEASAPRCLTIRRQVQMRYFRHWLIRRISVTCSRFTERGRIIGLSNLRSPVENSIHRIVAGGIANATSKWQERCGHC